MTSAVTRLDDHRPRALGAVQLVRRYSTARGSARAVLLAIALHADRDGTNAYPGTTTLAREAGVSIPTVKRARRALVAAGELEVVEQGTGERSTRYRITLSPPVGEPVDDERTRSGRGVRMTPPGGRRDTRGGFQSDPQPSLTDPIPEGVDVGPRCSRHRGVEDPPPCRGCATARERHEADLVEATRRRREEDRLRRLDEARAAREEADQHRATPETRAAAARLARETLSRNRTRSGTVQTMTPQEDENDARDQ